MDELLSLRQVSIIPVKNRIIIGCNDYYIDKFVQLLNAYASKNYPTIVFVEPQVKKGGESFHAYMYKFHGLNFIVEMPVMPKDKERVDEALSAVTIVMDTLSNPIEKVIKEQI